MAEEFPFCGERVGLSGAWLDRSVMLIVVGFGDWSIFLPESVLGVEVPLHVYSSFYF